MSPQPALLTDRAPDVGDLRASGRLAEFPLLAPLLTGGGEDGPDGIDDFEFGLARVLDGVAGTVGPDD